MTDPVLPKPLDGLLDCARNMIKGSSTKGKSARFKAAYEDLQHCIQRVEDWVENDAVCHTCEYCKRATDDMTHIGPVDPQVLICGECSFDQFKHERDTRDGTLADRKRSRE